MQDGHLSERWLDQEKEFIETFFGKKVPQILSKHGPAGEGFQCTAETCDDFAKTTLGSEDVQLVDNQGAASYTLICRSQNKIVQFRLERFDEHIMELAHKIYDKLVPIPSLINGFPLPVYVCPIIPGIVHIFQEFPKDRFPLERQLNTVRDLAAFVAKAAFWPQTRDTLSSHSWTLTAGKKLKSVASMESLRQLDPRFAHKAAELSSKLQLLDKLPLVLTHIDFAEVNLMVDPPTGHLTGVLDFDGARIEAFGMCIFGVYEGFFGEMRDAKWRFFDQPAPPDQQDGGQVPDDPPRSVRETLCTAFWDMLWDAVPSWMNRQELEDAVTVSLELGIINRYFDKDGDIDPENEDDLRSVNWAAGLLFDG
ncbi:hypothetical protein DV738_g3153, partial [Chaetothyriales sp. CBS 135597]